MVAKAVRIRRGTCADKAVERQKIEKPHQRLHPLDDVRDRLGLQRVEHPDQCDAEGEGGRGLAEPRRENWQGQRPPHDPEQRERGEEMDGEVERVISPRGAAQAVVEREGE